MISPDKTELAVWRYGIISRLLHRNEDDGTLDSELQQLASRPFRRPDGRSVSFSPETLRKWLYRYRHGGLPALGDMPKKIEVPMLRFRKNLQLGLGSFVWNIPGGP